MFEWNWGVEVNGWQTLATIGAIGAGLFVFTRLLFRFWPWMKKVVRGVDAVIALPDFMGDTKETMAEQSVTIGQILHELSYNKETSTKDAVRRVELGIKGIYHRLDSVEESVDVVKDTIEVLQDTDEKLADQIVEQTQPHRAGEE